MSDSAGVPLLYGMLALWGALLVCAFLGASIWARLLRSRLRPWAVVVAARPALAGLVAAIVVTGAPIWLLAALTHPAETPWIIYTAAMQVLIAVPAFWLVLAVFGSQARVALYRCRPDLIGLSPSKALSALDDFHPNHMIAVATWENRVASSSAPMRIITSDSSGHLVAVPSLRPEVAPPPDPPLHRIVTGVGYMCWMALGIVGLVGWIAGDEVADALAPVAVLMLLGMVTMIPLGGLLRRWRSLPQKEDLGTGGISSEFGVSSTLVDSGAQDDWLQVELQGVVENLPRGELTSTLGWTDARIGAVRLIDVEGLTTFTASLATHPDRQESRLAGSMLVAGAVLPQRLPGTNYVCVLPRWMDVSAERHYFVGSPDFRERYVTLASGDSALHGTLTARTVDRMGSFDGSIALLAAGRWLVALAVRPVEPEASDVLQLVVVEAAMEIAKSQASSM